MHFHSLISGRRVLCGVTLGLALCFPIPRDVAAASLDGTYDYNGSSYLTKYELNGNILSNGPLGTAAGPIQFTLNTLTYGVDPTYGDVLFGTYDYNGSSYLTKYELNGDIVWNGPLGTAAGPTQFTLNTLVYIPDSNIGAPVPEPPSFVLLVLGLMGLGISTRRSVFRRAPHLTSDERTLAPSL